MARARKKRTVYTALQKSTILSAASKDGLTALEVQKKFGVTPVTYYSWRKKGGVAGRRGRPGRPAAIRVAGSGTGLQGQVRAEVQSRVRQILPEIVRGEVSSYLDSLFGGRRGRRTRT